MAESEAWGEARVDEPAEHPVDTDPFAAQTSEPAEPPAVDHQFDYLVPETEPPSALAPAVAADPDGHVFDAFNANTWNFKPAPTPWYRAKQSVVTMVVVSVAAVALVVSVVLLAFRGPTEGPAVPAPDTSSTPTTADTTPETTNDVSAPLPSPPPPPPPPPTASEIQRAPVYAPPAGPTKKPEQNVTRKPMSVSPNKPSGRQ